MLSIEINIASSDKHLDEPMGHPATELLIATKFIPPGIDIVADSEQTITYRFWKGLFHHRLTRLKRLKRLRLSGLNEPSLESLSLALFDLDISPRELILDGRRVH